MRYICEKYETFVLFENIVDFREYEDIFDYEKHHFSRVDMKVVKKIENLGIKVTLPYSDVRPSTLDWDFVRDWKTCKTWDQEKFMKSAMKYRDGVVPSKLQSILDEK